VLQFLTFSRLESEGEEARQKESSSRVFERVLKLLSYRLEKEHVSLIRSYANDVPEVWMKINNIQQVFLNLVNNAIDAMGKSESRELTVDVSNEGEFVRIAVGDTGEGIEERKLNKIFEPFYTTKPVGSGTGLGLSVCHGIVGAHGGIYRLVTA